MSMQLVPYQGFIGGAYRTRSANFDSEECLNWYPETALVNSAKSVAALFGTPGLTTFAASLGGKLPVRGMLRFDSTTLVVAMPDIAVKIVVDASGNLVSTTALAGLLDGGTDPVSLASNGINVVISTNPELYSVDLTANTVTQIVDPDFLGSGQVGFLSGYFVWNVPDTGRIQYSELYSTSIDPASFFTAEASPDNLVGILVTHLELWAFGEMTTEVFQVVADATQPLQRIPGAVIEHGCAAAFTSAKMDNTVYWLGQDESGRGTVWRATGAYEPQRVSTPPIEFAIGQVDDFSDALAWSYQQEGHLFYVLSVGDRTWCFDSITSLWHERAWMDPGDGSLHRHLGTCQVAFANKVLVGLSDRAVIAELSLDVYRDLGQPIVSRRTGAFIPGHVYQMLQVDFETGVGGVDTDNTDPQAMLQWSDDGGHTWSNGHLAPIGKIGDYQRRVRWRRLGAQRRAGLPRCFRVTVTAAVKRVMTGAMLGLA